ncbi:transposase [Arthrobacter flavus]|uniref:Transposase n=1 Tax=Arthrobacter flavus TaxID=95172 RepID=A0ABW4QBE7_9MICC
MADYVCLIHRQSGGTYGWRRIRAELLDEYEMIVNRKLKRSGFDGDSRYLISTS